MPSNTSITLSPPLNSNSNSTQIPSNFIFESVIYFQEYSNYQHPHTRDRLEIVVHDLANVVPAGELGNSQIYSDRHIPVEVRDHMNIADLELVLDRLKGHDERSHHGLKLAYMIQVYVLATPCLIPQFTVCALN